MNKINLLGYTPSDMEKLMVDIGEKPYKGRQLFKWLYHLDQRNFSQMTDLKQELRSYLDDRYFFALPEIDRISRSSDGTEKYLLRLSDGTPVEMVMIPEGDKRTICLSTQTGCGLGCRFCATGQIGSGRNLAVGEIIGQLLIIKDRFPDNPYTNIVFMGMGEPLLNYDNVLSAVDIIKSSIGLMLSAKKQTISTVGITPRIYDLADTDYKVNLALSLHAPTDEKRLQIMPIAKSYPLKELLDAIRYYTTQRGKRVTFEYILFKGFNDSREDAINLAKLVRRIPCKINLLAYNPVKGLPYERPTENDINEFAKTLYPLTPAVTVRKSRGGDIDAACGQLAGNKITGNKEESSE